MSKVFETPDWTGLTVAVIANGPTLTAELAESARANADKTIAVNRAVRVAPWADAFIALDPQHHEGLDFAGLRIIGIDTDDEGAMYGGMWYETVRMSEFETLHIRNNLLVAVRIAAASSASKIMLVGVDTAAYEATHSFRGLTEGLAAITAELAERGIAVEFADAQAKPAGRARGKRAPELADENIGDA